MLLGLGKKSNSNAASSFKLGLVFLGKHKMLIFPELCSSNKSNLKVSIQLISLPDFSLAPQGKVWEGNKAKQALLLDPWCVLCGLCWCCLAMHCG